MFLPALTVAILLVPVAVASAAQCSDVSLHSGPAASNFGGTEADFADHSVGAHANEVWDNAGELYLRTGADPYDEYSNTAPMGCTIEEGREIAFPADTTSVTDLSVTRKVYADPDRGWFRFFDSLTNTGAAAITVDIAYSGNHYSDEDARIGATSSGDTAVTADDNWATQVDSNGLDGSYDSGNGWLNWQSDLPGIADRADNAAEDDPTLNGGVDEEELTAFFNAVTIQPGQTLSYITLWGMAEDVDGARAGAANAAGGPPGLYANMTAEEVARVRNWPAEGDADHDGVLNSADNCAEATNADQLNTDAAADGGDACDANDDNDGYTDEVEAAVGTDPKKADTDGDRLNDELDQCPRDAGDQPNGCRGDDRPPTVAFAAPADNARLSPRSANELTATAGDDRGVARVLFVDDGRVVCTDTAAPYSCAYAPTGNDVGSNTLSAVAVDSADQTTTAFKVVRLSRFAPRRVTSKTTPGSDASAPFTFTTTGRVGRPERVTRGQGCKGKVAIQIKSKGNTISTRRVNLSRSCTYRSKVSFRVPSRLFGTKLKVTARFLGNSVLSAKAASARSVKVG